MIVPIETPPVVRWIDDGHVEVDGTVFALMGSWDEGPADQVHLLKPRPLVERYLAHATELRGARIFEAGIFWGGSTAFLAALLRPEALIAIDIESRRNRWLDTWAAGRRLDDRVRIHHGVDQADRATIGRLLTTELGDDPLDLVVDDASHLLGPSTTTFEILFPRLRPGGLYVLEDWSSDLVLRRPFYDHWELFEDALREDPSWMDRPVDERRQQELWRLVLRLVVALGAADDIVADMELARGYAALRRGPASLDPDDFRLRDLHPGIEL